MPETGVRECYLCYLTIRKKYFKREVKYSFVHNLTFLSGDRLKVIFPLLFV